MQGITLAYIFICIGLVILAGLMSGLTLGLLSLDSVDMEVLRRSGTEREKKHAKRIEPVIKNTHLLLVTLLLTNAAAMEALPIFLDRLVNPTVAIILSVTAVLFFGEIIPQAACKSYGLAIGAYCAPIVRVIIFLTWPISKPISMMLDMALGEDHGALFRRGQLKALVDLHSTTEGMGGDLGEEEINVIRGALDLTGKQAMVAMTPLEKVFMVPSDAKLDEKRLKTILDSGHSRVPVHAPGNRKELLGVILVKELVLVDQTAGKSVLDLNIRSIPLLRGDVAAYDLLRLFQTGRSHMVALTEPPPHQPAGAPEEDSETPQKSRDEIIVDMDPQPSPRKAGQDMPNGSPIRPTISRANSLGGQSTSGSLESKNPIGIVTIEDVIEELLGTEIVDETDQFVDNLRSEKVNAQMMMKSLPPRLRRLLFARQGSAGGSSGQSTRGLSIKTLNGRGTGAGEGEGAGLRRTRTEDGKRVAKHANELKQPLLSHEELNGSPRSV